MHAVVTHVTIHDERAAENELREQVVPRISQAPGFVAGYWARKGNSGLGMVIFESEDAARAMSELVREMVPAMVAEAVTLEGVEVREVVAHA